MMLDLDYFKSVNDNFGHSVGDATLKLFARILIDFMADERAYVGRWGGEEFIIVCLGKSEKETYEIADKLRQAVEVKDFPNIGKMTCSIGVTQLKDEDTFEDAFDRVDKALYTSKKNERNRVTQM